MTLTDLLEKYTDETFVGDDCGGSRVLNALGDADLDLVNRIGLACLEDAIAHGENWFRQMCAKNEGAVALALGLAINDYDEGETVDLGWDAWIVIGEWEAQVTGHEDGSDAPMPIHPEVAALLRRLVEEEKET